MTVTLSYRPANTHYGVTIAYIRSNMDRRSCRARKRICNGLFRSRISIRARKGCPCIRPRPRNRVTDRLCNRAGTNISADRWAYTAR